jgi:hypothetical protein
MWRCSGVTFGESLLLFITKIIKKVSSCTSYLMNRRLRFIKYYVHDENCFVILVIKLLAHRDVFNQTCCFSGKDNFSVLTFCLKTGHSVSNIPCLRLELHRLMENLNHYVSWAFVSWQVLALKESDSFEIIAFWNNQISIYRKIQVPYAKLHPLTAVTFA